MITIILADAIYKLKPTAQFSYTNEDYNTIKWDVLEGEAPTQAEIDVAFEQVKADKVIEIQARAEAKALAEAKLAALGLTADDLRALGL